VCPRTNPAAIAPPHLAEDDLTRLCQQADLADVAGELLARHFPWVRHIIGKESKRMRLERADSEDAQQEAVLAFLQALAKFDTGMPERPDSVSFRTFLRVVVTARFRDYVRRLRRWEAHHDRTVQLENLVEASLSCLVGAGDSSDPYTQLTWQEFKVDLDQALGDLKAPAQQMWEWLAAGQGLRQVAADMNISYPQGKRLRQRVFAELAAKLSVWRD
jgi:RNA polymerase sigma factor (sigma-70 family)